MKYYVEMYFGMSGRAIVEHRRIPEDDETIMDELVYAAYKLGLKNMYPAEDVMTQFCIDEDIPAELIDSDDFPWEDFDEWLDGWELCYYEDQDLFYQFTGVDFRPMPPNTMVGIIEQNQRPLFKRYRSGLR